MVHIGGTSYGGRGIFGSPYKNTLKAIMGWPTSTKTREDAQTDVSLFNL